MQVLTRDVTKGDYSRLIREASMVVEKLPVVVLPSGRVPGRVLLVLPILEAAAAAEQRWDREKSSSLEGFGARAIYMQKGVTRGGGGAPGAPWRGQGWGRARWPPGPPLAPLWPIFGSSRSFLYADFSYIFPGIFGALLIWGKPEIEKQQKTGTGTVVH